MPIRKVVLNSTDLQRSVDFYRDLLEMPVVEDSATGGVLLDGLTAGLALRPSPAPAEASTWIPDNLQSGFRHIGFKVTGLDDRAARLHRAGVEFLFEPLDVGPLRICFFYDPDGTLLEMLEGPIPYTEVIDPEAVAAEASTPTPPRPRFDHVALTVRDRARHKVLPRALRVFTDRHHQYD
jgi:catechol 2,3-dioxygenase-like lactoylglutathione lyase family enzyme